MKDARLTELMLKSLTRDPSLASYEDWMKAGDYAANMRFFPHSFKCFQNAMDLEKNEEVADRLNTILDKVTNVLEIIPPELKVLVEDFRLDNPLDPEKWLEVSNKLLSEAKGNSQYGAAKIAMGFAVYCCLRVGMDVDPLNEVLSKLILKDIDAPPHKKVATIKNNEEKPMRVVALGDNVTLGLEANWEVCFDNTYHYMWGQESGAFVSIANCGTSGAGVMDAVMYLGRDVINYKPDLVFINFGVNDAWLGAKALDAYEALLESVVEIVRASSQVVLISPVPHIPENCPAEQRPSNVNLDEVQIEEWVKVCSRVAAKTGVPYADAYSEFPKSAQDRKKYFGNGFNQLNREGQKLILKAINEVVKVT